MCVCVCVCVCVRVCVYVCVYIQTNIDLQMRVPIGFDVDSDGGILGLRSLEHYLMCVCVARSPALPCNGLCIYTMC